MDLHPPSQNQHRISKSFGNGQVREFLRRQGVLTSLAYAAVIGLVIAALEVMPDAKFGLVLTFQIGLCLVASMLLLWPRPAMFVIAPAAVLIVTALLDAANRQKSELTVFPVTTTDLKMLLANPFGLLMALGAPNWAYAVAYAVATLALGYVIWSIYRMLRRVPAGDMLGRSVSFGLRVVIVVVALILLNLAVVRAVKGYLYANLDDLAVWEPEGMVDFSQRAGILGFLIYSYYIETAERENFLTDVPAGVPPPPEDVAASVAKYVRVAATGAQGPAPNIIIVHAESTFDPNDVLRLRSPVQSPLFHSNPGPLDDPMVHVRGPAIVNVIGGGSWVSEFEVITGLDSRLFGVAGRFTHASLSQYARNAFPIYLARRGYESAAFTNSAGTFYNYAQGYLNYGFDRFYDNSLLAVASHDEEIMSIALQQPRDDPDAPFLKYVLLAENHSPHWCDPALAAQYEDIALVGAASEEQTCALLEYVRRVRATERAVQMAPLRNLGPMAADFSGRMAYGDAQKLFDPLFPAGAYRCYWTSHFMTSLSDEMIDDALANAIASPSDRSISSIWNFGGATARPPAGATAFGERSFGWMYALDSVWERAEDDQGVMGWTRNAWTRFRRHSHHGRIHLNFAGQDQDSAALTKDAFGRNYDRLAAIKHRYDPTNMFRVNQNIQPAAAGQVQVLRGPA